MFDKERLPELRNHRGLKITNLPDDRTTVLITNARIFDGRSNRLSELKSVLVGGNCIARIGKSLSAPAGASVIDAEGRAMTPGFIGAHEHAMLQMSFAEGLNSDQYYHAYVATETARTYLMHGFTAIRDVGGNSFSLKKAIDRGIVVGPRIYPSGPMISQTAGHADHRTDCCMSKLIGGGDDLLV